VVVATIDGVGVRSWVYQRALGADAGGGPSPNTAGRR
jgi:hypothetical protein